MGCTSATVVILTVCAENVIWNTLLYLSVENLVVDMVVSAILPSFNSTTIDVGREPKVFIPRRADLYTVTVSERDRKVN